MTIGFDINEANIPQRVGVNRVAYTIFNSLVNELTSEDNLIALSKDRPLPDLPSASNLLKYETFGPQKMWVLTGLTKRLFLNNPKIDILFSPSHYVPLVSPVKTVSYLMDLSFERFGNDFFTNYDIKQLKLWTPLTVKKSTKVFTISEFSKSEIVSLYHTDPAKIEVLYPGIDREIFHSKVPLAKQKQIRSKYNLGTSPYFLYVGTLQPRKNIIRLIRGFSELKNPRVKLVIGGKKGWLYDQIFDLVKELKLTEKVIFTGFLPDEDIPALIKSSLAYVLPSLYEGFGMPPVEAQAVGVPVVVSRISSLPEAVGESAIYIEDPYSTESITNALNLVTSQSSLARQKMIELGKLNAKRFNWQDSAQKLLSSLRTLSAAH